MLSKLGFKVKECMFDDLHKYGFDFWTYGGKCDVVRKGRVVD